MRGFQDLASQQQQRFWYYQGTISGSYQTWNKPPGISFVNIICVGAGGGGGGGSARRFGVTLQGATGGGSGALTSVTLPAWSVPDTLYILPGYGGNGGTGGRSGSAALGAGTSGVAGTATYVSYYPNITSGYTLCVANGGGAGVLQQQGNGAITAGAASLSTAYPNAQIGLRNSLAGHAYLASTGGTVSAQYRVMAGGGNAAIANTPSIGGAVQPAGELFTTVQGPATEGAPGMNGMIDLQKFIAYGGSSGYSSVTQDGGLAGAGGPGCGGAGGAYGFQTGSDGGRGGDGFVIITCG